MHIVEPISRPTRPFSAVGRADLIIGAIILAMLGLLGVLLSYSPPAARGPTISLSLWALPLYALLSTARMCLGYVLSLAFGIGYAYLAAHAKRSRALLLPLLDILQSVPILSFLPVVLLSLNAVLPTRLATELAAIALIFTSQAWNLTFSFYQSLTTIPIELREAAATFRFGPWLRFRTLELPIAANGLVWNSMMSWAGGWFFLMASESFRVGRADYRLAGLGAYLQAAAEAGDLRATVAGLSTLVVIIVALDQIVWRPLLTFSHRFRIDSGEGHMAAPSWFYTLLAQSNFFRSLLRRYVLSGLDRIDQTLQRVTFRREIYLDAAPGRAASAGMQGLLAALVLILSYGIWQAGKLLLQVRGYEWGAILVGVSATFLRVAAALLLAAAWTIPLGVLIGSSQRVRSILQPLVQIVASIPATAIFPFLVVTLLPLPGGVDLCAVALILLGTQWYLLFNIIAGASAIPGDLQATTAMLRLPPLERWRVLVLPAIFPYLITGMVTAGGGAWNSSIVAERIEFSGGTFNTVGIGDIIAQATADANYGVLLAATAALVVTVVSINRFVWGALYRLAARRFSMDSP